MMYILVLLMLTACGSTSPQRLVEATRTPAMDNFSRYHIPTRNAGLTFIARGSNGNMWFLETNFFIGRGNSIARISPEGLVTEFPLPASDSGPFGLTAGPDGNIWFTEENAGRIGRITPNGDLKEYPLAADSFPRPITVGPDGNLWFVELHKLGRITPTGTLKEYPLAIENVPPAIDITTGPDGNLWFSFGDRIARMTLAGKLTVYNGNGAFLAVGADGNFWSFDITGKLWKITPSGVFTAVASLPTGLAGDAITKGPDGNLWAALVPTNDDGHPYAGKCGLARITPNDVLTVIRAPVNTCAFRGITAGPDNTLWVTDWADNVIWRYRLN
jgi:streptogramin lyase